ncbi:ribonuclease P protein component [Svornostia abyssi]|uniref:Ribonuclease P protein component n=1 Tax=Svornostia abyssi TaxID=2898438 RepID=A0ABY5PJ58_9ACTN|nr:ribonuclease P protein component [Parviterribacteraceae bacterium J379]
MDQLPHQLASPRRAKRGRLSRSAEFERVYRQGRSHGGRYLVLHVFPRDAREPADSARLGLSVSRKVGGAVERNRVKRLLREAFATQADRVPSDHDVVIVARPGALELCDRDGLAGVQAAIAELLDKAGLPAADA